MKVQNPKNEKRKYMTTYFNKQHLIKWHCLMGKWGYPTQITVEHTLVVGTIQANTKRTLNK